ncbi:MAG: dTDP-4-dehydrorhamnose 3,5-epimerase family protein, partial [Candidatus Binatia bacterium]
YMTTEEYAPAYEAGVNWKDPDLAITWPTENPELSERDTQWPSMREADNNFEYVLDRQVHSEG